MGIGTNVNNRWVLILPTLFLAACGGDAGDAPRPPATEPVTSSSDSAAGETPSSAPADSAEAGMAVVAERRGDGYVVFGRTDAQALELSVEDGHNVLFGPAVVELSGGAFRIDVTLDRTDRDTVFAFFSEPGGERQWVVPVPLDGSRVAWGAGAAQLTEPAS